MKKKNDLCPWQHGPALMSSARKLIQNPRRILAPYLSEGMTTMDIGCGMGYFTLPMSHIVGGKGNVVAVDLQAEMLEGLKKNIQKAGVDNVIPHQCAQDSLHVGRWNGTVDFALIFWMLHEVSDPERLIMELHTALSPQGKLLFAEPVTHVSGDAFQKSSKLIAESGFTAAGAPRIQFSRAALFQK